MIGAELPQLGSVAYHQGERGFVGQPHHDSVFGQGLAKAAGLGPWAGNQAQREEQKEKVKSALHDF
ncbi:hypothetical protein GCM10023185_23310 [Hymenobacter saemangeumensis]|uniref:Uncharacterized protein n=1 Tax=Hymenobacter saemangeumensis TaxID=1084522 RepID=A0ABP8IGN4_9BACT